MAAFLFDASALAKRYLNEAGSEWVRQLLRPSSAHTVFVAQTTPVELIAAVTRRQRGGALTAADAENAISDMVYDFSIQYRVVGLSHAIVQRAMDLARLHGLRGYDAIQLATAVFTASYRFEQQAETVILVSSDGELNQAATAEGLMVFDPNDVR